MSTTAHLFTQGGDGTVNIDTWLTQETNNIMDELHRYALHKSAWYDLTPKGVLPRGEGYELSTLIYERTLPNTAENASAGGATLGLNWTNLGTQLGSDALTNSLGQNFAGSSDTHLGPQDARSVIHFARTIKRFNPKQAFFVSPLISVEDLMFAKNGAQQLSAAIELMKEAATRSWIERHRDEYDRACAVLVPCLATGTPFVNTIDVSAGTVFEGVQSWAVDYNNDFVTAGVDIDYTPTAHVSESILKRLYMRMIRAGAGSNSWGMERGRPVLGLVISGEASDFLHKESGVREDLRKSSKVDDLLLPLGVDTTLHGFAHIIDDLAPRMTIAGNGTATRIYPETMIAGVLSDNPAYDTAEFEIAYVLHKDVMRCLMPQPMTSVAGASFDPYSYAGDVNWLNIKDKEINPLGKIGFFRADFASASELVKTRFGAAIVYKRTSPTPGA
jgi:hypothetical protein